MEDFFKIWILIWGMLDSWKYHLNAKSIVKYKSTYGASRKSTNIAIVYRVSLFLYAYYALNDWAIYVSCIIGLYTLVELFYIHYLHYPYKNKKRKNFKRPSIWKYLLHSLTLNKWARRL